MWLVMAAAAWEESDLAWPAEALPVEVTWSGKPPGFTEDEVAAAVEGANAAWTEEICSEFGLTLVGERAPGGHGDGRTEILFEDPGNDLDGGLIVVTALVGSGRTATWNGIAYDAIAEADTVFNDGFDWATDADIAAGDCDDAWSLQAFLTRQLGVLAGLDLEWDIEDVTGACDSSSSTLDSLDVYALTYVYGTPTLLECSPAAEDTMAVQCHVSEPAGVTATWDFGDGEVVEGDVVSHTYAAEGRFVVKGCVELEGCDRPTCVTFDATARPAAADTAGAEEEPDESNETGGSKSTDTGCATAATGSWLGAAAALFGLSRRTRRYALRPG